MGSVFQDIRYGLRCLARSPGFSAIAILTLAVSIAANTSIFSLIEAVVLRPLPYPNPDRLFLLANSQDWEDGGLLYQDFRALKSQNQAFEDVAAYYRDSGFSRVTLTGAGESQSVQGGFVTANLFSLMGMPPILGRFFTPEEEMRRDRVVLLSHGLWVRRFGGSPDVIGKPLKIDGFSFQVIGVMPEEFQFPASDQQFWAPITTNGLWEDAALTTKIDPRHASGFYQRWQAIGRLKPGVKVQQAQAEIDTIFARISQADKSPGRGLGIVLRPLRINLSGNTRLAFSVLFSAVIFVLLIACTNVVILQLARGSAREREITVRVALGANRSRLVRQLFTESLLLALLSGCLGLLLVPVGLRGLLALAPADIPRLHEAGLDGGVLAFSLGISFLAAMLFGLAPAWKASDAGHTLNSHGTTVAGSVAGRRAYGFLVFGEFAIATVLLVGAGLLVRSFLAVEALDPGFQPEHVITVNVSVPQDTPERANHFYSALLERLQTLPGVQFAGAIDSLFDLGKISNLGLRSVEGRAPEPRERWTPLRWTVVRGDYFQAMGVQLLRGRYFSAQDGPNSPLVAIIDESMAQRYWPGEDAMGKRFKGQDARGNNDDWLTVVGIVHNMRRSGLEREPIPHIYQPYTQAREARTADVIVRVVGSPASIAQPLRAMVREVDEGAITSSLATMEAQLSEQLSPRRFQTSLLSVFSLVALFLAGAGIYGVLEYSVSRRTHEIGVRMALGARPQDVVNLVMEEAAKSAMAGLVTGAIAGAGLARIIRSLLFEVPPSDPVTFVSVGILLVGVMLLACYGPARRAIRVAPMVALRNEG
jgi:predicted permease